MSRRNQKIKICVVRNAVLFVNGLPTSQRKTGVFTWRGPTWMRAELLECVQELPADISDAELRACYRAVKRAHEVRMLT